MCKVTKKNYTHKYFKPIYLFLRILGAKKGMEHKKRWCVISPDNGSKVGLKAQKLLAQGIALGNVDKKQSRPERAKAFNIKAFALSIIFALGKIKR